MRNLGIGWQSFISLVLCLPLLISCIPLVALGDGAGTGPVFVEDRRTSGVFIEDEAIELKSTRRIDEQLKEKAHVNVTSFNRNVLLTGEVLDGASKELAERLVMSIENVHNIVNEIAISDISSFSSRSNDALITSKVKGRLLTADTVQINHIKVVTENRIVYLLGMVRKQEGNNAAVVASSTSGVLKVIKVFEYLD